MQQDRLIGAAGEGRYGAVRGWAGRPEYGNACSSASRSAATDVERLDLGLNRAAHRARDRAAGRVDGPRRRHPPPPPRARRGARATSRPGQLSSGSTAAPAADAHDRRWATSTPIPPSRRTPGCAPPASARPMRRRTAPSPPSPGRPASRRRRWTPTASPAASTTSGSAARSAVASARLAFDRPDPEDPTLYPSRPPRASSAHLEIGVRRGDGRSGSPIAATGATPRRTRSRRSWPRSRSPAATGSSSTSGCRADGVPVLLHDETLERVQGVDAPGRRAVAPRRSRTIGVPTPRRRARRGPAPRVPRRRAQGRPRPRRRSRSCRRPRARASQRPSSRRSSRTRSSGSAGSRRPGRAGSTPWTSTPRRSRRRPSSGAAASRSTGTRSTRRSVARGPGRGPRGRRLDGPAAPDLSTGSQRLGVVAICVEAAALDG